SSGRSLDCRRALDGFDDTGKFDQEAITNELYETPSMPRYGRIDQFGAILSQGRECAEFVFTHHAAVSSHVSGEDRGKAALYELGLQQVTPLPKDPYSICSGSPIRA